MKFFLMLFFTTFNGISQMTNDDNLLLQSIVNIEGKTKYSYCSESVDISSRINTIKRKKFYERVINDENICKRDTILKFTITDAEVQSILQQIKDNKNYIFLENLLQNSVRIEKDSIKIFMDSKHQEFYKKMRNVYDSKDSLEIKKFREDAPQTYDYRHECYINFLSKPIYIRNKTIALIFNTLSCNSGGYNQLAFYEKKDKEWVSIVVISSGSY